METLTSSESSWKLFSTSISRTTERVKTALKRASVAKGERGEIEDGHTEQFVPSHRPKRPRCEDSTPSLGGHDKGDDRDSSSAAVDLTPEARAPLKDANLVDLGRHRDHISHAIQPWAFHGFQQPNSEHASETAWSMKSNLDQDENRASLSDSTETSQAKLESQCLQDAGETPSFLEDESQDQKGYMLGTLESLWEEHIWFGEMGSRPGDGLPENEREPKLAARKGEARRRQPYQKDVWHSSDNTEGILSTRGRFRILQDDVPAHVLDVVDPVKIRPGHDAQFACRGFTWTPQMMTDQIGLLDMGDRVPCAKWLFNNGSRTHLSMAMRSLSR